MNASGRPVTPRMSRPGPARYARTCARPRKRARTARETSSESPAPCRTTAGRRTRTSSWCRRVLPRGRQCPVAARPNPVSRLLLMTCLVYRSIPALRATISQHRVNQPTRDGLVLHRPPEIPRPTARTSCRHRNPYVQRDGDQQQNEMWTCRREQRRDPHRRAAKDQETNLSDMTRPNYERAVQVVEAHD